MYNNSRWELYVQEEGRRLMREMNAQDCTGFKKLKKMVLLGALMNAYRR